MKKSILFLASLLMLASCGKPATSNEGKADSVKIVSDSTVAQSDSVVVSK